MASEPTEIARLNMEQLIADIDDLIVQATTERSHYYTASVLKRARAALTAALAERARGYAQAREQAAMVARQFGYAGAAKHILLMQPEDGK